MGPYDEIVVRTNLEKVPTTEAPSAGEETETSRLGALAFLGAGHADRPTAPSEAAPAEVAEGRARIIEGYDVSGDIMREPRIVTGTPPTAEYRPRDDTRNSVTQGGQAASAPTAQQPQQRASQLDRLRQQAKQEPSVLSVEEQKEGRQKREEAQGQLEFARKLAAKGDMEKAKSYFQDVAKEAKDADSAREAEEALNALDDAAGKKKEPARRPDKTRDLDAKKPQSTSTEVTDHFETPGDKNSGTARGKEGAVADIPLGGTGVGGASPVTTPKTQPPVGPDSGLITHDVRDLTKKVEDFPAPDMPAKPKLPGVLAAGELVPGALRGRRQEENLLASAKAGFARGGLPLAGLGREIEALDERPGFVFASANLGRSQGKVTLRVAPTGAAGLVDVGLVALAALAIWRACRASARAGAALSFAVAAASFVALCVGGSEVAASAGALMATGIAGLLVTGFREKFSAPGASPGAVRSR